MDIVLEELVEVDLRVEQIAVPDVLPGEVLRHLLRPSQQLRHLIPLTCGHRCGVAYICTVYNSRLYCFNTQYSYTVD
jgi:hypothetical protein